MTLSIRSRQNRLPDLPPLPRTGPPLEHSKPKEEEVCAV